MDKVELKSFPSNRIEALTMLYLSQKDLTHVFPENMARLYMETYKEIQQGFRDLRAQRSEALDQ